MVIFWITFEPVCNFTWTFWEVPRPGGLGTNPKSPGKITNWTKSNPKNLPEKW